MAATSTALYQRSDYMAAVNTAIAATSRSQDGLDALKKTAHCRELAGGSRRREDEAAEGVGGGTAVNICD